MIGIGYLMGASFVWTTLSLIAIFAPLPWYVALVLTWLSGLLAFKGFAMLFERQHTVSIWGPNVVLKHRPVLEKMLNKEHITVAPVVQGDATKTYVLLAGVGYILSGAPLLDRFNNCKTQLHHKLHRLITSLNGTMSLITDSKEPNDKTLVINANHLLLAKDRNAAWFRTGTHEVGQWYFTFEIWRLFTKSAFNEYNVKHLTELDREVLCALVGLCALACVDRISSQLWNSIQQTLIKRYPEHETVFLRVTYAGALKLVPNLQAFMQHAILQMNRKSIK